MWHESSAPRILIVDDDEAILELVTIRLEIAGFRTSFARDGVSALAAMKASPPHGVVLDIGMPRLDGFGVLRSMAESTIIRDLPVLVMTARHAAADVKTALELGAIDYLSKPFQDSQLIARVRRLVARRTATARDHRKTIYLQA